MINLNIVSKSIKFMHVNICYAGKWIAVEYTGRGGL